MRKRSRFFFLIICFFNPNALQWLSSIPGGAGKEEHISGEKGREKVQPDCPLLCCCDPQPWHPRHRLTFLTFLDPHHQYHPPLLCQGPNQEGSREPELPHSSTSTGHCQRHLHQHPQTYFHDNGQRQNRHQEEEESNTKQEEFCTTCSSSNRNSRAPFGCWESAFFLLDRI